MKKYLLTTAALTIFNASYVHANALTVTNEPVNVKVTESQLLDSNILNLQKEWARIKYLIPEKDSKIKQIRLLEDKASILSAKFPKSAEIKIWEAIILSTDAGITKSMSGLSKVKKAKKLLEAAIAINPKAMNGSAYTSIGSLYYQVPGWPVSFGNSKKAEKNLKKSLSINSSGIDPNFFYADYLYEEERYKESYKYLNKAMKAPSRSNRPVADDGRRQEIRVLLTKISGKLKDPKKVKYN